MAPMCRNNRAFSAKVKTTCSKTNLCSHLSCLISTIQLRLRLLGIKRNRQILSLKNLLSKLSNLIVTKLKREPRLETCVKCTWNQSSRSFHTTRWPDKTWRLRNTWRWIDHTKLNPCSSMAICPTLRGLKTTTTIMSISPVHDWIKTVRLSQQEQEVQSEEPKTRMILQTNRQATT